MNKKRVLMSLICFALITTFSIFIANNKVFATETYTGENSLNLEYTVNSEDKVEIVSCTSKDQLSGSVTIPNQINNKDVVLIGSNAFSGATNITGITIPDTVKEIGKEAFKDCTSLANVDLCNIETLSAGSFEGCTALNNITIPSSLKNGPSIVDKAVFKNCTNLTEITFEEGLTVIPTRLCMGTNITSIKIPDSVETIGTEAFRDCTSLTDVDLGNVIGLATAAFEGCTALKNITIPSSLKNGPSIVDKAVFRNCTNLTEITFEEGLTIIPTRLFSGIAAEEILVPNSVETIGFQAFSNCSNLKKITILNNVTHMGSNIDGEVFPNHNDDLTIYCYRNSVAAKHAIDYNIKYVYLDNPTSDNGGNTNNDTDVNENVDIPQEQVQTPQAVVENSTNPKTGDSMFYIVVVLSLAVVGYTISLRVLKTKKNN